MQVKKQKAMMKTQALKRREDSKMLLAELRGAHRLEAVHSKTI
jgi:hypothetical protein